MQLQFRYYLYVIAAAVIAAGSNVVAEIALRFYEMSPFPVAMLSNLLSGLVLLIAAWRSDIPIWHGWQRTDWLKILAVAICIYSIAFVMRYESINLIGSGKATLLGRLETIFVVIMAVFFLKESLSVYHWIAGTLCLLGVLLINFDPMAWQLSFGFGEFLAILSPIGVAVGIIVSKPLIDRLNVQWMTGLAFLFSVLLTLPFWPIFPSSPVLSYWPYILIVFVGVGRGMAWLSFNLSLPHIGVTQASVIFLSTSFFTIIFQVLIARPFPALKIQVPVNLWLTVFGGIFMVMGILILTYKPKLFSNRSTKKRRTG
ncbi:MAG: DMT family transporter [Chloroflexota bacterium]